MMFEFLLGIVVGFLIHDLITYIRFDRKKPKEEIPSDVEPTTKALIEHHDGIFYAFSEENQFLGQNAVLEELAAELLGNNSSILLASSDLVVIEKLRQLVSSDKSHHIVDETNQVQ